MVKAAIFIGLVLALPPVAALAQQGTSSSYGSVGWGPVIPTQALTPRDTGMEPRQPGQVSG